MGLRVKPRLHAWHSHRQSRSHFAFSSLLDQWEIRPFSFFETLFLYKITVSFTMVIKRSRGGESAGGGRSTSKSTCVVPDELGLHLAIDQHLVCPNRARRELWPRKWFFLGRNRLACRSIYSQVHVDRRRWRSILVWSHQLTSDLKRCLLFLEMLALVESESSFSAYVCHRRPARLHSD